MLNVKNTVAGRTLGLWLAIRDTVDGFSGVLVVKLLFWCAKLVFWRTTLVLTLLKPVTNRWLQRHCLCEYRGPMAASCCLCLHFMIAVSEHPVIPVIHCIQGFSLRCARAYIYIRLYQCFSHWPFIMNQTERG